MLTVALPAGSVLIPSSADSGPSTHLQNGHLTPLDHDGSATNGAVSSSESELSDVRDNIELIVPPSKIDHAYEESMKGDDMLSSQDEDAEGSEDGDYDLETPPPERVSPALDHSSSNESSRSMKRKASMDENELILQNPELYGLRRSVGLQN
jgi:chromodomain-helicase-DNA-binding protein 1